ncbi:uncharacterized protein LY79DRAFT_404237 [Colletotrichum navitas]|uniref:Uncharacterized protein n=1 Tax=Colletotrichum navitas TaxID=681940 RepID=A0AAD8Q7F5_9PEZI|nr:uncharacterized protein LY79DRAFT_404237 [Colletotrichum navitas]KAK1597069.1 hypothetical protein LY79DRAFT_404237 [Colletotrichum navitas]
MQRPVDQSRAARFSRSVAITYNTTMALQIGNHNTVISNINVRHNHNGVTWLYLTTGSSTSRNFLFALAINAEEEQGICLPSQDISVRMDAGVIVQGFVAKVICCESYFCVILVQSRGRPSNQPCANKCAQPGSCRFTECRRLPNCQAGACAECIW